MPVSYGDMEHTVDRPFPKVSIMIPTYNQEHFIAAAIESALAQDYPNLEIVVSDDCSADSTFQVASRYLGDRRLRLYKNPANLGRIGNYREALYHRVTGQWTINIDGDDYLNSADVISCMATQILSHQHVDIVAVMGSQLIIRAQSSRQTLSPNLTQSGIFRGTDIFLNWHRVHYGHLAILYNSESARALPFYRLNIISSDWESVLTLIIGRHVAIVDKIIAVWNIHDRNISGSFSSAAAIEDYEYIEASYSFAVKKGIQPVKLLGWRTSMINLQTQNILMSSLPLPRKLFQFIPFIARRYPFALFQIVRPKVFAVATLRLFPKLYSQLSILALKFKERPNPPMPSE
jgi:glycosyltransferase involved in cell wall biosynthesis